MRMVYELGSSVSVFVRALRQCGDVLTVMYVTIWLHCICTIDDTVPQCHKTVRLDSIDALDIHCRCRHEAEQ